MVGAPHLFAPQKRMNCEKNRTGYKWLNFGSLSLLPPLDDVSSIMIKGKWLMSVSNVSVKLIAS